MPTSILHRRPYNFLLPLAVSLTFLLTVCSIDQKFNKEGWNKREGMEFYPNRDKMLNDLLQNHQLKGLSYEQLVELLDEPTKYADTEKNTVYYNIITDYGYDIDPVYIKHLVFKLNTDSIVVDYLIKEYKH